MNHTMRVTLALLVGVATSLSAQTSTRWDLFQTLDWEGRLAFLDQKADAVKDGAFLLQALDLVDSEQIELGSDNASAVKRSVALKLIRALVVVAPPGAVVAIARIPVQYKDPTLRGESWLALAKLGDQTSVPELIRVLTALNETRQRGRAEEIQASYALQAIGILKAADAFRAVAAASQGWYTPASGLKPLARKTMALIVPDLEAAVLDLLANDEDLALREGLFEQIASQSDFQATARASAALLGTLVRFQPRDKSDQDATRRLLLSALVGAQAAKAPPATLIAPIRLILTQDANYEQMMQGIQLLGKIDDPTALEVLTATLEKYNKQQKAGTNTPEELSLTKQLFLSLAQTGKKEARVPLDEAKYSDYTPALRQLAVDALAKLPGE